MTTQGKLTYGYHCHTCNIGTEQAETYAKHTAFYDVHKRHDLKFVVHYVPADGDITEGERILRAAMAGTVGELVTGNVPINWREDD